MKKTQNIEKNYEKFVGFDSEGEVFTHDNRVFRGIFKNKGSLRNKILEICRRNDLFQYGVVNTKLADVFLFPELSYDLILEHEKIPFISYPHEWPHDMLKDAALFHINLYMRLAQFGLTLKDFHPLNILFDSLRPVFIDFTSIIFSDELINEDYLKPVKNRFIFEFLWNSYSKYLYEMYRVMFAPYLLFPLYLMKKRKYKETRFKMLKFTLNTASAPPVSEREIYTGFGKKEKIIYVFTRLLKKLSLAGYGNAKRIFLKILKKEIEALGSTLDGSDWTNYYEAKNENFNFGPSDKWTAKNWTVYESIKNLKPKTVLDVACNTGWFSILASKMGCQVVAVDSDEACINLFYQRIKEEKLPILPLLLNFALPTGDIFSNVKDGASRHRQIAGEQPLILAAHKRLKCEMVMALGIIHHLTFREGMDFRQIAKTLNMFCERYLILEFIPIYDRLVQDSEDYYSVRKNPEKFNWYTLENLIRELRKYFNKIEIKKSFPKPRIILLCMK